MLVIALFLARLRRFTELWRTQLEGESAFKIQSSSLGTWGSKPAAQLNRCSKDQRACVLRRMPCSNSAMHALRSRSRHSRGVWAFKVLVGPFWVNQFNESSKILLRSTCVRQFCSLPFLLRTGSFQLAQICTLCSWQENNWSAKDYLFKSYNFLQLWL